MGSQIGVKSYEVLLVQLQVHTLGNGFLNWDKITQISTCSDISRNPKKIRAKCYKVLLVLLQVGTREMGFETGVKSYKVLLV